MKKYKYVLATLMAASLMFSACGAAGGSAGGGATKEEDGTVTNPEEEDEAKTEKEKSVTVVEADITQETIESSEMVTRNGETFPFAAVTYSQIDLSDETEQAYPELAASIKNLNDEFKKGAEKDYEEAIEDMDTQINDEWMTSTNLQETSIDITRADDKIFSFRMTIYISMNGPHPYTEFAGHTFDVKTGKELEISDVVSDMGDLPQMILDNAQAVAQEDYAFTDEEKKEMMQNTQKMTAENKLPWYLDSEGLQIDFSAYDLLYYAFGPISCTLTYDNFPDFVKKYGK